MFMNAIASAGSNSDVVDYITIASTGNATDFGDTTSPAYRQAASTSSSTRAVVAGKYFGNIPAGVSNQAVIDYFTIASTGNASDFGDLSGGSRMSQGAGASNKTRGIFAGGFDRQDNQIEYITIASTGNSTTFGDLIQNFTRLNGSLANAHGGLS
jgi:hypothetical protein